MEQKKNGLRDPKTGLKSNSSLKKIHSKGDLKDLIKENSIPKMDLENSYLVKKNVLERDTSSQPPTYNLKNSQRAIQQKVTGSENEWQSMIKDDMTAFVRNEDSQLQYLKDPQDGSVDWSSLSYPIQSQGLKSSQDEKQEEKHLVDTSWSKALKNEKWEYPDSESIKIEQKKHDATLDLNAVFLKSKDSHLQNLRYSQEKVQEEIRTAGTTWEKVVKDEKWRYKILR